MRRPLDARQSGHNSESLCRWPIPTLMCDDFCATEPGDGRTPRVPGGGFGPPDDRRALSNCHQVTRLRGCFQPGASGLPDPAFAPAFNKIDWFGACRMPASTRRHPERVRLLKRIHTKTTRSSSRADSQRGFVVLRRTLARKRAMHAHPPNHSPAARPCDLDSRLTRDRESLRQKRRRPGSHSRPARAGAVGDVREWQGA